MPYILPSLSSTIIHPLQTMLNLNPTSCFFLLLFLFSSLTISLSTRSAPGAGGGFFGPGFDIPGLGNGVLGGGFGSGYGSPSGGRSRNGIFRSSFVCKEKGPCYKKKVTCPAKCFTSFSRSGKNYGGGGGGGGCTVDCSKKCIAYC
uniref:Glycine-rich protein n=1 Tax=Kalanchoe fedtschenkoi TaxID=63787 RepID=A0A7N0UJN1_KALFE